MDRNPLARLSIVAYKPKSGKSNDLLALVNEHVPYLRSLGLATDRPHIIAKAQDEVVIEVFEWAEGALEKAHTHPGVGQLWTRFSEACDFVPLNKLPETAMPFANFIPFG